MPIGVRTPVDSMSMRFLIGCVQMLGMPGKRSLRVHLALQLVEGDALGREPREEPAHAAPARPSTSAASAATPPRASATTVVSTIENGAGSVGESARPALPKTRSTSGKLRRIRSWICRMRCASVTDMPGSAVGM